MNVSWRVIYPFLCGVVRGQRPLAALIGKPYLFAWSLAAWSGSLRLHFITTAGFPSPLLA